MQLRSINLARQNPSLVLVGGPTNVGKTAIINALLSQYPDIYDRPLSYTSRPRRPNEGDGEYVFVSREEMEERHRRGAFVVLDEAYGEYYGIDRASLQKTVGEGRIAIKEVHPSNHERIRGLIGTVLSVGLLPPAGEGVPTREQGRASRLEEDRRFYEGLNPLAFDIPLEIASTMDLATAAKLLHGYVYPQVQTRHYFPLASEIDSANASGYGAVAREFSDDERITTRNFHDVSKERFKSAIAKILQRGDRCVELGPGRGWLTRMLPLDDIEYVGIDISDAMLKEGGLPYCRSGSARFTRLPTNSADVVFASLIDPFCYPGALCEVRRILRPTGRFVFSAPSRKWADGIRGPENANRTAFVLRNKGNVPVYSFTFTGEELRELLRLCGLEVVDEEEITCGHIAEGELSPAITESARNLGIAIEELPVVNFGVARRATEE